MAGPGLELIAGLKRDPQFGPVVIVGLGGILTEVFDDVALGLAPLAAVDALVMLGTLRGSRLLDGVRGRSAIDRQSVAEILVALGRLAQERPDVLAVDLNPVVASDGGAVAVDALVVLADPAHP
jgi:acyl-CoA synthetase (NDP forming)